MSEGALIAGVGLVGIIVTIVTTEREPITKANELINAEIVKKTKLLCENNTADTILEDICKLRRRKAHLQKDVQNCAATWSITALCLIIYGFLPSQLVNDVEKTTILIISCIAMLTFSGGLYYMWRLLREIKKIKSETCT